MHEYTNEIEARSLHTAGSKNIDLTDDERRLIRDKAENGFELMEQRGKGTDNEVMIFVPVFISAVPKLQRERERAARAAAK